MTLLAKMCTGKVKTYFLLLTQLHWNSSQTSKCQALAIFGSTPLSKETYLPGVVLSLQEDLH